MDEGQERTDESKRFEANLRHLLRTAYNPPEPRREFKGKLLSRLKDRQAELARERARARRIRYATFGSMVTGLAATIALVVGVLLTSADPGDVPPGVSAQTSVAQSSLISAEVEGVLDLRNEAGRWQRTSGPLRVSEPVYLRASHGQALVQVPFGAQLVLDRNAEMALDHDRVRISRGRLHLDVPESAQAVRLRLPSHDIIAQPGSVLDLAVQPAEGFAPGGVPAPEVIVYRGTAKVESRKEQYCTLLAGHAYQLHDYTALDKLSGERLDEKLFRDKTGWVRPQLVNFITRGKVR